MTFSSVSQCHEKLLELSTLKADVSCRRVHRGVPVGVDFGVYNGANVGSVGGRRVKEVQNIVECGILENEHLLGHGLCKSQEAPLAVVPRVGSELPLVRLQALANPADAKLEVALGTVQRTDDQVYDAKVEELLIRVIVSHSVLLLLNLSHELLGVLVLTRHDVRDTKIRQHGCGHIENILGLFYNGVVISDCVLVFGLLHEEHVGNIEPPSVILHTELCRLPEERLHHGVVLPVPVNPRLSHEHRHVRLDSFVEFSEAVLDVLGSPCHLTVVY
mmetsp:Transcript_18928/g.39404  ORF Transcript_18928/g.39404 Transcript_18928/m.39404 type:complete len:274 (+) Transcript_18928:24-845(+)